MYDKFTDCSICKIFSKARQDCMNFSTDRYSLPFIRSYSISEIAGQIKVESFFQGQDCSGKQKFWLGVLVQGKPEVGRKLFLISDFMRWSNLKCLRFDFFPLATASCLILRALTWRYPGKTFENFPSYSFVNFVPSIKAAYKKIYLCEVSSLQDKPDCLI